MVEKPRHHVWHTVGAHSLDFNTVLIYVSWGSRDAFVRMLVEGLLRVY